ncbi:hypothetical protein [Loigolactobacillus rennini]|nr:hypothetical protein [Loigolactobacillus rennini]
MRQTDYGTVACWQERNLLAKIDRDLKRQAKHCQSKEQNNKPRCKGNDKV